MIEAWDQGYATMPQPSNIHRKGYQENASRVQNGAYFDNQVGTGGTGTKENLEAVPTS